MHYILPNFPVLPMPPFAIIWPLYTTLHLLAFLAVSFHCLRSRRNAPSAVLWLFMAWSFPIIGALCYLAFGINRIPAKGWQKHQADQEMLARRQAYLAGEHPPPVYWDGVRGAEKPPVESVFVANLNAVMDAILADYPALGGNQIRLLIDGDQSYPEMLNAIRNAKHHIHFQSFIIRNDVSGKRFLDLLADKAREGVNVRVIYDRFGSTHGVLSGFFRQYLDIPNFRIVGWTQANPIKRQFQINLRNHRKALIVDGMKAFCGGINISDANVSTPTPLQIHDYHFAVDGPIVQELQYSFLRDWYFMTDENPDKLLIPEHFPEIPATGQAVIRVVNSGPTTSEIGIVADVFFSAIVSAQKHLLIITPYYVPGDEIMQAMRSAALRGVRIQLVVPRKSNHIYAGLAGRALYEDLLKIGVEIYERRPPFTHAKALLVDDVLAIVGTANFDHRSLRLNYETNLAVFDADFINDIKRSVHQEIAASTQLDLERWQQRPLFHKLVQNFCNLMTPVL